MVKRVCDLFGVCSGTRRGHDSFAAHRRHRSNWTPGVQFNIEEKIGLYFFIVLNTWAIYWIHTKWDDAHILTLRVTIEFSGHGLSPNTDVISGHVDLSPPKTLSIEPMHGFGISRRSSKSSRKCSR